MPLHRGYIVDPRMTVFIVVPVNETCHPCSSLVNTPETLGVAGGVFEGLEQGFRIQVVVAYRRTGERSHDAQLLQRCQHVRAAHRASIVRVERDSLGVLGTTDAIE